MPKPTGVRIAVALCVVLGTGVPAATWHAARLPHGVASSPDTFELVGTVREESTGRPVPGALIVVDTLPTLRAGSGADGHYRIPAIPRGSYLVSARKLGYYIERREVSASCPVVIVDSTGRHIGGGGPCDPDRQVLNFYMRPHVVR